MQTIDIPVLAVGALQLKALLNREIEINSAQGKKG